MNDDGYIFDTGTDQGRKHLSSMEQVLDKASIECLEAADPQPGQRCLELGAGAGSITRWMAERVGPTGRVVAVDLDTKYITPQPGVDIFQHDINDGLPDDGPYDLIHARCFLVHLPQREQLLKLLVDSLAPGGWLVLGDLTARPLKPVISPSQADSELFERMLDISHNVVSPMVGIKWDWGYEIDAHMTEAGLTNVDSLDYSKTVSGGGPGCQVMISTNIQAEPLMRRAGVTDDEFKRYRELLQDPNFRTWFYRFICSRGQKPA